MLLRKSAACLFETGAVTVKLLYKVCAVAPMRGAAKDEQSRMAKQPSKPTRVQVHNPVTKQWVKLDTKTGRIVDSKKSPGPYQNVPKK